MFKNPVEEHTFYVTPFWKVRGEKNNFSRELQVRKRARKMLWHHFYNGITSFSFCAKNENKNNFSTKNDLK